MRFDRGECQTYAKQGIGDATDCWKPVFINLLLTDLLVEWLELLFLTSEARKMKEETFETYPSFASDKTLESDSLQSSRDEGLETNTDTKESEASQSSHCELLETERNMKKLQIEREAIIFLPSLILVMMDHIWDKRLGMAPILLAPMAEFASFYWFVIVRLSFSGSARAWNMEMVATMLLFLLLVVRTDEPFQRSVKDFLSFPLIFFETDNDVLKKESGSDVSAGGLLG